MIRLLFFVFIAVLISGCGTTAKKSEDSSQTAEQIYDKAETSMSSGKYAQAVEEFQEVERKYPFSPLAIRAQVMAAYAYYKDQEYTDALGILERFIKVHPGNVDVGYAYYLRSLSYYERIVDVKRDQKMTKLALDALNDVVIRFPETQYARDAKLKLDLARDHLAGKEMEIGRFYQQKGQYIAAVNRFKTVIKDFDTTSHVPEALYRLTEIYLTLGVQKEARRNAAVLGHNFSDSKWYRYAYRLAAGDADSPLPDAEGSWFYGLFDDDKMKEKKEEVPNAGASNEKEEGWLGGVMNVF